MMPLVRRAALIVLLTPSLASAQLQQMRQTIFGMD